MMMHSISSELSLVSALGLGLLGSAHCFGMCGGIASALSLSSNATAQSATKKRFLPMLSFLSCYNIGRILSYTLAGLLFGLLGASLKSYPTMVPILQWFAALMLIAMGCYLAGWWRVLEKFEKAGHYLWRYISPIAQKLLPVNNHFHALYIGLLWGWLPCGLVYSTLIWAGSSGSGQQSAVLMLFFGLGTLPSMLITGLAADKLRAFVQMRLTRQISGLMIIIFGLWSIPGSHHMWLMMSLKKATAWTVSLLGGA